METVMPRLKLGEMERMSDEIGQALGEALAKGIAAGMQESLAAIRSELSALGDEVAKSLVDQARRGRLGTPDPLDPALRKCQEPGCSGKAIARGFCRRHYARLVYQERKARTPPGVPIRATKPRAERSESAEPAKAVAPVAPIVRRKGSEADAPPDAAKDTTREGEAQAAAVTAQSVARFFGLPD